MTKRLIYQPAIFFGIENDNKVLSRFNYGRKFSDVSEIRNFLFQSSTTVLLPFLRKPNKKDVGFFLFPVLNKNANFPCILAADGLRQEGKC